AEALPDPDSTAVRIVIRLVSGGAAAAAPRSRTGAAGDASPPRSDPPARPGAASSRARSRTLLRKPLLDTLVIARDGAAWAYAWVPARKAVDVRATLVSASSAPPETASAATRARAHRSSATRPPSALPAVNATRRVASGSRVWTGFARSMPAGVPLAGAPGTREPDPELHWINRDGFVALERDSSGVPLVPQLPGNRMWARAAGDRDSAPAYVAIAGGALVGRRIVPDPDGGGDPAGRGGRSGSRAANLNLEVARAL